jgi:rare lipoprotein A
MGWLAGLMLALLLGGCASKPPTTPAPPAPSRQTDGPLPNPPPDLQRVPDAEPRLEPIRQGGPNKPYEVGGERYEPLTTDQPLVERGLASWYGRKFHGRPTASGEVYNMYAMTAAHATMPIPSYARVRNPANGREVVLRINDRGPFHKGRIIDLSYTAALKLDVLHGVAPVEVVRITYAEIRAGLAQRAPPADPPPDPPLYAPATAEAAPQQPSTGQLAESPLPPLPSAPARAAKGFWVQLGAFKALDGAESLRQRVVSQDAALAPLLTVIRDGGLNRLQAGPYASREDASQAAAQLRASGQAAVVVERR